MTEHPPCEICDGAVKRHEGESELKWLRRRSCSRECSAKLHSIIHLGKRRVRDTPTRICQLPGCNKPILRHDNETTNNFNRRRTHSPECALAMKENNAARARERRAGDGWPKITGDALPVNCFAGMDVQTVAFGRIGTHEPSLHREAMS